MAFRQHQHRVAKGSTRTALRRNEVGAAGGVEDVLVGSEGAFRIEAVEKRWWRQLFQHELELPHQIVDVLDAAVSATGTERRNQMSRIADKQRSPMSERRHAPTLKRVHTRPFDVELSLVAE